ncbi:MAG: M23 family metallopeptidase [Luteibaculum sp.]
MAEKKFLKILIGVGIFVLLFAYSASWLRKSQKEAQITRIEKAKQDSTAAEEAKKKYRFGIPVDDFEVEEGVIARGQAFSDIMLEYGIQWDQILEVTEEADTVFNLSKIKAGNSYTLYLDKGDSLSSLAFWLYQISPTAFLRISLQDSITVKTVELPVVTELNSSSLVIENSLYEAFQKKELPTVLALKLADIYAWTVDFYRLNKEDKFHFIYESQYTEGNFIGIGRVLAAVYISGKDTLQAYRYYHQDLEQEQFFNEKGENLQRSMLKSPVEFGRISSRYSLKRFHPVQKRFKAHLGTDYAAPYGTPILAVGNGTVEEARYSRFNGNYVKIKHNQTYTSQYLHMSKFAKGMRPGKKVMQGDIIGYVGATGLATGPHVCFRLWKYGKQVDHLREKFSPAEPLPNEQMPSFSDSVAVLQTKFSDFQ